MNTMSIRTLLAVSALAALLGCKKDESPSSSNPPSTDKITLGTSVDAGSSVISTAGGTVAVNAPGSPIDGLTITVPPNAYGASRTFTISYAPIEKHGFGDVFRPISPMIQISNGGGYTDSVMRLKIPVHIPADEFAMVYFYNEKTQTLEALPLLEEDSTSITVGTMHFDPNNVSNGAMRGGGHGIQNWRAWAELVVASVTRSFLASKPVFATGFVPGFDDWEFINMGSYIAPGGHCAGQSLSAMWYYYEHHLNGEPTLSKQFDLVHRTTDVLWQDNRRGYRFASTVQCDQNFNGWIPQLVEMSGHPEDTFYAFAAALAVTGEPQSVIMASTTSGGGHAMIVYAVAPTEGKLYIADPNYPGDVTLTIPYANHKLGPYVGRAKAGAPTTPYDLIGFFAKTAFLRWDRIGNRYTEFQSGTIGNDRFPVYRIEVSTEGGITLGDTLRTGNTEFDFDIFSVAPLPIPGLGADACLETGDPVPAYPIPLAMGWQKIGIYVWGHPDPVKAEDGWIDFRWVSICRNPFKIESTRPDGIPITGAGEIGTAYTLRCNGFGYTPANAKYVWDFDDGGTETKINDSTVTHTFSQSKTHHLKLEVWDNATATKLADVTQDVVIAALATVSGSYDSTSTIIGDMKLNFHGAWSATGLHAAVERDNPSYIGVTGGVGVPMHASVTYTFQANPEPFIIRYDQDFTRYEYTTQDYHFDTTVLRYGVFPNTLTRTPTGYTIDLTFAQANNDRIVLPCELHFTLVRKKFLHDEPVDTFRTDKILMFRTFYLQAR